MIIDVHHDSEVARPARSREVLAVLRGIGERFDAAAAVVREVAPTELATLPPVPALSVADWQRACPALVELDAFLAAAHAQVTAVLSGGGFTPRQQLHWSFVLALHTIGLAWRDAYLPGAHYVISPELFVRPGLPAAAAWGAASGAASARARRWAVAVTVPHFRAMSDEVNAVSW
ncbi:hypothetical protein [Kitasatospora phosalacinea]|uniref:Uncharacterized protein n=1 Tax=Kitasatospora phosalacinea TaxID=2065 RepID=A0A9W6PLN5_9ACTN|nr:hypothetical protein [Kitasatospora phosalacinea]GLW58565.1 hypothetical protein Kpho01_65760 [Kitasatospora phosalacinea]